MPPSRAAYLDLESAFKAALKGLGFGVLATDWDKVDEYLNVTFLQWWLAINYDLLPMLFCIMSFFNFVLVVYYLPRRFWLSRLIMGFSCFLYHCGVIYYGDVFSTSRTILCVWCFVCLFAADYYGM